MIDLVISVRHDVAPRAVAGDVIEIPRGGKADPGFYTVLSVRPDADRAGWRELELRRLQMVRGGRA